MKRYWKYKPLLVVLSLFFFNSGFTQIGNFNDSVRPRSVNQSRIISDVSFRKLIDSTYASIATGQGQGVSLANYGAIDPVAGKFSLNFYRPFRIAKKDEDGKKSSDPGKAWYLAASAGGALVGDNVGVLFNNSKFNSGVNISGKLLIPIPLPYVYIVQDGKQKRKEIHFHGNSIEIDGADVNKLYHQKQELEYNRWIEKRGVYRELNLNTIDNDIYISDIKIKKIKNDQEKLARDSSIVAQYIYSFKFQSNEDSVNKWAYYADSLHKISDLLKSNSKDLDSIWYAKNSLDSLKSWIEYDLSKNSAISPNPNEKQVVARQFKKIDKKYDALIDSLELHVPYQPFTLGWLGLLASFNRNDYYTYNDSLTFSNQITNNTYSTSSYGLELNLVRYNKKTSWFLNLGGAWIRNNNITDLTTSSVTRQAKTADLDTTHTLTKTYNAYTDSIIEYKAWKLYANIYLFFRPNSKGAIHFMYDVEWRNTNQNPINAGVGYIFSFKNSKDNAVLNAELYFKFLDINKAISVEEKFFNRNQVGITFGIPLNIPSEK